MADCNFEWSMCQTCAKGGSNQCPLENNRTIKEIKDDIRKLKSEVDGLESRIDESE